MAGSKSVVLAALVANGAIAILKFAGYLVTGSPAMLSETYHSISDTGNQVFLLIGLRYGGKSATRDHPFGYGKAQFFYSFLVSVLLFGIAGWESLKHGYHAMREALFQPTSVEVTNVILPLVGAEIPSVWVNYAVLVGAIIFESYAFKQAYVSMSGQIDEHGWSGFREAFKKTADVTVLTALTEDTIALGGAGIALLGIFLTRTTGNPIYDATSAAIIGVMLMGFAVALAWENKRLLLGESVSADVERGLRNIVLDSEGVADIIDFRTVYFGPENVLVTADIAFDAGIPTGEMDDRITAIEQSLIDAEPNIEKVYIEPER
ncbi:MAG: cation diffusion facilitator family transporter [Halobacteriales archaeon]|nr:cation diffusion facilitator family transporter [Halobacteriales archaeon]